MEKESRQKTLVISLSVSTEQILPESLQGGSGIGLSIVKKIIEDHGGYVWATSKEGEGTCMHFVIRKYTDKKENNDEVIV